MAQIRGYTQYVAEMIARGLIRQFGANKSEIIEFIRDLYGNIGINQEATEKSWKVAFMALDDDGVKIPDKSRDYEITSEEAIREKMRTDVISDMMESIDEPDPRHIHIGGAETEDVEEFSEFLPKTKVLKEGEEKETSSTPVESVEESEETPIESPEVQETEPEEKEDESFYDTFFGAMEIEDDSVVPEPHIPTSSKKTQKDIPDDIWSVQVISEENISNMIEDSKNKTVLLLLYDENNVDDFTKNNWPIVVSELKRSYKFYKIRSSDFLESDFSDIIRSIITKRFPECSDISNYPVILMLDRSNFNARITTEQIMDKIG